MKKIKQVNRVVVVDGQMSLGVFHKNQFGWFCDRLGNLFFDYTLDNPEGFESPQKAAEDFMEILRIRYNF